MERLRSPRPRCGFYVYMYDEIGDGQFDSTRITFIIFIINMNGGDFETGSVKSMG